MLCLKAKYRKLGAKRLLEAEAAECNCFCASFQTMSDMHCCSKSKHGKLCTSMVMIAGVAFCVPKVS